MLSLLRRIIQEVNAARNIDQALRIIVTRVREAMDVDVCSVYLTDEAQQQHVLMATEGLHPDAVGKVRLGFDAGIVSEVARRAEPVNLDNAPDHPSYHYFPESSEEQFHGYLGVPIIHHRSVLGVLVVQQIKAQRFDEDHVTFLITIAAQLAGAIAHAEITGDMDKLLEQHDEGIDVRPIRGLPGAHGVAIGTAVTVFPSTEIDSIPDRPVQDVDAEIERFGRALKAVKDDITTLSKRMQNLLPAEERALFDAYLLMLDSHSLRGETVQRISQGNWAPAALRHTIEDQTKVFMEMDDPYLKERAEDVRDLGRRILLYLQQENYQPGDYPLRCVLVGDEVTAAMLAEVPQERLAGVVAARGSRTSHVAILARALGIPAVMGAKEMPLGRLDGRTMIVDGYSGNVYISPPEHVLKQYEHLAAEEESLSEELMNLRDQPAVTEDGRHVPLYANTGLLSDISPSIHSGAEGIGLYRTEFPFLIRQQFPGEEEQYQIYRQALQAFAPRPVTLRTLDVGGDKALPYFPIQEENPFLGWRGIRITLDHPEIFLVQVRAMMRASAGLENLQILLPMISHVHELDEALVLIHRAFQELLEEGEKIVRPKLGVMIEVPSAVYQAASLARRVDFLSIGTNDLTQYLLAVDRNNAYVAELYDSLHPAVLNAVQHVIDAAHAQGKRVSVCGEMAGDPAAAVLLVGMGVDYLSMSASSMPRIKWVIRNLDTQRAKQYLEQVSQMEEAVDIRQFMNERLEDAGLGGLVRAGR
jgi:phosphotransferase system enzyme I (PtsP)